MTGTFQSDTGGTSIPLLSKSAALNYLRELMRNEDGNEEQVLNLLSKLPENNTDPLVSKLEDEVIAEYKKRNS